MAERRAGATVWTYGDDRAWSVAETPSEVADAVHRARVPANESLVELTLVDPGSVWNGRALWVDAFSVRAVSPPLSERDSGS